jgi:branched-chain amino acid transport system permease protein
MIARKNAPILVLAGFSMLLLAIPSVVSDYHVGLMIEIFILTILGYSFKILFSAGYLSLGIAGFYAAGAYTFALYNLHLSKSLYLALASSILVSALLGVGIGALCVRRHKMYFAVLTLAFSELLRSVFWQWRSVFGGDEGISGVTRPALHLYVADLSLTSYASFYYLVWVILVLCLALLWRIENSNFGYVLKAIQDNPERMPYIGANVQRYVLVVFVISAMLASLAGVCNVCLFGGVNPMAAHIIRTVEPQVATLIGGVSTFGGPLIGSLFYVFIKDYLMTKVGNWMLIVGALLMALVVVFRRGILGYTSEKMHVDL